MRKSQTLTQGINLREKNVDSAKFFEYIEIMKAYNRVFTIAILIDADVKVAIAVAIAAARTEDRLPE